MGGRELIFLRVLEQMLATLNSGDGFDWVVKSVSLYESGPMAMFVYNWRNSARHHEAFSCMSLRWSSAQGFHLMAETCSLGPETTQSMKALENRLQRAKKLLQMA